MEPTKEISEKPAWGRNIVLNLLVLVLLFIMVRSILGWSQPGERVSYSNFKCSCKVTLPGNWVQKQPLSDSPLTSYEVFKFENSEFFSNKSFSIFHTLMDNPDESGARDWSYSLLHFLDAANIHMEDPVQFGNAGYQGFQLGFDVGSWEGRLIYFFEGENVYAIELAARSYSASQSDLMEILNTFSAIE